MLRSLILAHRDPTESEARILCGFENPPRTTAFREAIQSCYPLVQLVDVGGEDRVVFASEDVRQHLRKDAPGLLATSPREQNFLLADRCLTALLDFCAPREQADIRSDSGQEELRSNTDAVSDVEEEPGHPLDTASHGQANELPTQEQDPDDSEYWSSSFLQEAAEEQGLRYATTYWLVHGRQAGPDFAEYLSEDVIQDSNIRFLFRWLLLYLGPTEDTNLGDEFQDILQHWKARRVTDEDGHAGPDVEAHGKDLQPDADDEDNANESTQDADDANGYNSSATARDDDEKSVHDEEGVPKAATPESSTPSETASSPTAEQHLEFLGAVRPIHVAAAFGYSDLLKALIDTAEAPGLSRAAVCQYTPVCAIQILHDDIADVQYSFILRRQMVTRMPSMCF